jgi:hypothetical protein
MAKSFAAPSREILEAALQGLEAQREKLTEQINEVRSMLGGGRRAGRPATSERDNGTQAEASSAPKGARKKRTLSPEARKRIAAAQKKRWAAFRKGQ